MNCPSCRQDIGTFRYASKFKACPNCGQVAWHDGTHVRSAPHNILKGLPLPELQDLEREQLKVRK